MGIKRLISPTSTPAENETVGNDSVKSGQSNGASFAALAGILTAVAAGIPGIIKATGINSKTTPAEAAVIIGALLLTAVGIIAVAWVLVSDFSTRAKVTMASPPKSTAEAKPANAAKEQACVLKIVDEEAQLPVITARYDADTRETVYLAVPAGGPPKWVKQDDVKSWITA